MSREQSMLIPLGSGVSLDPRLRAGAFQSLKWSLSESRTGPYSSSVLRRGAGELLGGGLNNTRLRGQQELGTQGFAYFGPVGLPGWSVRNPHPNPMAT